MTYLKQHALLYPLLGAAIICAKPDTSWGAGPLMLKASGQPIVWPNGGRKIRFNPDQGSLGSLSNSQSVAQTIAAFAQWENIATATTTYVNAGLLPFDVDETNFFPVLFGEPDGSNPIVYDDDGAIFTLLFGEFSGFLGFAGFDYDPETGEVVRGVAFLNGGDLEPGLPISESILYAVQVHEFGHYSGLNHTIVNGQLFTRNDTTGPTPTNTFPKPEFPGDNIVETMYPFIILDFVDGGLVSVAGQETLHADDVAGLSALYPEAGFFENTATITGQVLGLDGATPVSGVNVIARNVINPFEDAVSSIAGSLATTISPDDAFAGVYSIPGLTPGAEYAIYVDKVMLGSFSVPQRLILPGPEEFYNGPDESDNYVTEDPPDKFTPVLAAAGTIAADVNIVFNRPRPGEIIVPSPDPNFAVEFLLPFTFEIGGRRFKSVFLNTSGGNLTFGEPAASLYPLDFERFGVPLRHLPEPPAVAGLASELLPYVGGAVSYRETPDTFTIEYLEVPGVSSDLASLSGPNTFSITLHAQRGGQENHVTLSYGQIDLRHGLAGYTCGSALASRLEPEFDLSALHGRRARERTHPALFEDFANEDNDLDNLTLTFEMPGQFIDKCEPNDSQAAATKVKLPFNTVEQFADVTEGDTDWYRFSAQRGDIFLAETAPGSPVRTSLCLFDSDGTLLAENHGLLWFASSFSRLIYTLPVDGDYSVRVTPLPGSGSGRYAMYLNTYRGAVLPLGDDATVELPLNFSFPFQGTAWRSVWVNSDGNLTFGMGDSASLPRTVSRFLNGPPRIAPFFADLDPTGDSTGITGLVLAEQKIASLTIHWVSVPTWSGTEPHTFSVTLDAKGDIKVEWGLSMSFGDVERRATVGLTQGNGALDPGSTDLTGIDKLSASGTVYEAFTESWFTLFFRRPFNVSPFDLCFRELTFTQPGQIIAR